MSAISPEATLAQNGQSGKKGTASRPLSLHAYFALIALAAFGIYWFSSYHLETTDRTRHFFADIWFYTELAEGNVFGRLADNYHLDRIFRFHPTTVVMGAGWMQIVSPLTPWIEPERLLRAMFALVGAIGVWAALWAFAAVFPRRYAVPLGIIYASSVSVWFFSSIEESKIVSATLTALYIATYLHLRTAWTKRGALLSTAILLLACLNEIVAGFLIIIPIVDTLVQRGWDWRQARWIALHGLAGPIALAILEGIMRGRTGPATTQVEGEGANHLSMLLFYLRHNEYSFARLYEFLLNWLFFSVAAPSTVASLRPADEDTRYFEPALLNYFSSPVSTALVLLFAVMLAAIVLPRYRGEGIGGLKGVFAGLLAFALLRGVFFFVLNPSECFLWTSGTTLAHLLMLSIPFAASSFPAKPLLLAATALFLFVINGRFIIGV